MTDRKLLRRPERAGEEEDLDPLQPLCWAHVHWLATGSKHGIGGFYELRELLQRIVTRRN
jgi:hypothetical protein